MAVNKLHYKAICIYLQKSAIFGKIIGIQKPMVAPKHITDQHIEVILHIPAKLIPFSGIRLLSGEILRDFLDVNTKWVMRFETIIDELVNNAVGHGSAPSDIVTLKFFIDRDIHKASITVSDHGSGEDSCKAADIKKIIQEKKEVFAKDPMAAVGVRGRGLAQIITKWTDTLIIFDNERGGITMEVSKIFGEEERSRGVGVEMGDRD